MWEECRRKHGEKQDFFLLCSTCYISSQAALIEFRLERWQAIDASGQIVPRNAGRERLVIPEQDEIGLRGKNGGEKVIRISQENVGLREGMLDRLASTFFILLRQMPLNAQHVRIARDHHEKLSSLLRLR